MRDVIVGIVAVAALIDVMVALMYLAQNNKARARFHLFCGALSVGAMLAVRFW